MKPPLSVNAGSRSALERALLFTIAACAVLSSAAGARADRVVVLPVTGSDDVERMDDMEDALAEAVRAVGHESMGEGSGQITRDAVPQTANEMRAIAEMQSADWVVAAAVQSEGERYRVLLRAYFLTQDRLEEVVATIDRHHEEEDFQRILSHMLVFEGMGDYDPEAERESQDADAQARREAEERERQEAEERARQEAAERERQRAEQERQQAEQDREHAWENRERYDAENGAFLVQGGVGLRGILAHSDNASGGLISTIELRVGYALSGIRGLELRGGLDIAFSDVSGFALYGGAVYLFSPFAHAPVHFGPSMELGMFQALSGNRVPSFMVRASGIIAWHATGKLYLEASLPEIMVLSANGGVVTLGGSARIGFRF